MNKPNLHSRQLLERDLARVIEPLASYICAADQPRSVLRSAVAALLSEVEQTHQLALAHCGAFAESNCA
jgi:hypothetical protein